MLQYFITRLNFTVFFSLNSLHYFSSFAINFLLSAQICEVIKRKVKTIFEDSIYSSSYRPDHGKKIELQQKGHIEIKKETENLE